ARPREPEGAFRRCPVLPQIPLVSRGFPVGSPRPRSSGGGDILFEMGTMQSVGRFLREKREEKRMSVAEVARATRVPVSSVERIEGDQFDELPAEVFVRGFLKSYARAVGVDEDEVLALYTASRRSAWVTPLPLPSAEPVKRRQGVGMAVAFVLLLILFTLALSIVLKPRRGDMPQELSELESRGARTTILS